jgi:endonuclease VIII
MSEGPEVRIMADKIHDALSGKRTIQNILHKNIDEETKSKIIGSSMEYVKTFGKNIVVKFSSGVYLRNHMMMWGKWRVYDRGEYDGGSAKSPPRYAYGINRNRKTGELQLKKNAVMDVRNDARVRLTLITADKVLLQFNGPILQFSLDDPAGKEPIKSLGPDGLSDGYDTDKVQAGFKSKSKNTNMLIANALLDQQIISGIGNKYKSEILFLHKIYPFKKVVSFSENELSSLLLGIPKILGYGYRDKGRTRPLLNKEKALWDTTHWVFRRSGKQCWVCGAKIVSEKKLTSRSTYWCPTCQPIEN